MSVLRERNTECESIPKSSEEQNKEQGHDF
jgi:hypothetical protein